MAERSTACSARSVAETLDQKLCRIFQKLFEGSVHYALLKKGRMAAMISCMHCKKSLADSFSQLLVLSTKLQLACLAAAFGRYLPLPHHLFFQLWEKTFNA